MKKNQCAKNPEAEPKNVLLRCSNCFKSHLPHPKFCKWVLLKHKHMENNTKELHKLSNDDVYLINERIKYLEHLDKCTECTKDIFLNNIIRNTNSNNVIKLKGGHKKIPSDLCGFETQYQLVNIICNILRSLGDDWNIFSEHKLCSHTEKKRDLV